MLEAQIREHASLAAARPDTERKRETRHDLKTRLEIDCCAEPGRKQKLGAALRFARTRHFLCDRPYALEHQVQPWMGEPDDALTESVTADCGGIPERVPRSWRVAHASVGMCNQRGRESGAERQLELEAGSAGAESATTVTGRQHYCHVRSKRDRPFPSAYLIAVGDSDVSNAGACRQGVIIVSERNGITQLVRLPRQRPLLSESVHPCRAAFGPGESAHVLHDPTLLVVGLFDEKAVVLDRRRSVGGGRGGGGR